MPNDRGPVWSILKSVALATMIALLNQPTSIGQSPTVATLEHDSDIRLGPLKTLDDHFPFEPPQTAEAWDVRHGIGTTTDRRGLGLVSHAATNAIECCGSRADRKK